MSSAESLTEVRCPLLFMSEEPLTLQKLRERFPDKIFQVSDFRGDLTVVVPKETISEVMRFLRDDPALRYDRLVDVTAVDYSAFPDMEDAPRFAVVYHLYSHLYNRRLRVKAPVPERDPCIDSMVPIWIGAIWLEREVYDMFGLKFIGHPDLRRILMPVGFEGYPLRKDFPLKGKGDRDRIVQGDPGFTDPTDVAKDRAV